MPRRLPSLMAPMAGGSAVNAIWVWLPSVELTASGAPLNGTMTRPGRSNICFICSAARCGVEPVAGCA